MQPTHDLIQSRINTYLKSTYYTRWIIIAIVGASFWFMPNVHRAVVATFLVLAVIYNIAVFIAGKVGISILTNRVIMLLLDGFMSVVLVSYTGYTSSPYLFVLVFMVLSAAFWYGARAIILIAILQASGLIAFELLQHRTLNPKNLIVRTLIVMTFGIYVSWLTKYERVERNELIRIGTETEKERQRLSALINSVRDSVLVLDNRDRIAIHNEAAAQLLGGKSNIRGQLFEDLVHFEDADERPIEFKISQTRPSERKDLRLRAGDNSIVNVQVNVAPYIVDRQNRGNVVILHDISEDKTIAQEREEFIAVASHELRTPLAIAESDLSMLLSPSYLPENKESVSMLNGALRSLTQLSHIISDLTNLSQVEDEQFEVDLEPLNPVGLLREFQADYEDQAKSKGLDLSINVPESIDAPSILTSQYVVREILTIFISNAIKFTDSGNITLSLIPSKDKNGITFGVQDSGIGISQSDQNKIFEKFFQSEHYQNRVHGGTGLGLYIAKQLATRITAEIWFESELGKGSTFYLWVPPYSKNTKDRLKVATAEVKDFFGSV